MCLVVLLLGIDNVCSSLVVRLVGLCGLVSIVFFSLVVVSVNLLSISMLLLFLIFWVVMNFLVIRLSLLCSGVIYIICVVV